jgi:F-BAR domain only protein
LKKLMYKAFRNLRGGHNKMAQQHWGAYKDDASRIRLTRYSIFQAPWQRIVSGTENLAQSHEMLAQKIETDVETPLRQFATKNREMQSMTTVQGNLAAIAKDFESAQKKAEKLRDKSGRPDRVANASSSVDDASQQWESQAPYVFEQLQSLDEARVNFLRDALTQFQTHEVDQVERNRTSAESCLNALLNIETADEIKTFAAKISGGTDSRLRRRSSAATGARPQSASLIAPPTPPSRGFEDGSSSRVGTSAGQDRLTPSTLPVRDCPLRDSTDFCVVDEKSKKSSFGGIKRIGTVMSRRKSTAPPPPTPEKRKEKSRFPFRRGDSSRSFQEVDSPTPASGQGLTPVPSQDPDPTRVPQPQYTRGETNGVTSQDGASDAPRTNGNNFAVLPTARNIDQPLPQVSQRSLR